MNQMRRRMISPRSVALFGVNRRDHHVADLDRAFVDRDFVNYQARNRRIRVIDRRSQVSTTCGSGWFNARVCFVKPPTTVDGTDKRADITNLSTRLGVERRLIENDAALRSFT